MRHALTSARDRMSSSNVCGARLQSRRKWSELRAALAPDFSVRELSHGLATLLFRMAVCVLFLSAIPAASAQNAAPISGADVYQKRCSTCHDQAGNRAPSRDSLQKMPAVRILRTLDFGLMMGVAYPMKREERQAVANYLGTPAGEPPPPASSFCAAGMRPMSGVAKDTWAGWSPSPLHTPYQTAYQAGLTMKQVCHLKLKWALGFPGFFFNDTATT